VAVCFSPFGKHPFIFLFDTFILFVFLRCSLPPTKHVPVSLSGWITLFPFFSITLQVSSASVAARLSLVDLSSCTSGYVDTNKVSFLVSICKMCGMPLFQGSLFCDTLAVISVFLLLLVYHCK